LTVVDNDNQIDEETKQVTINPKKITASKPSRVVFADDEPLVNFGHTCHYLMYDNKTGSFLHEIE